MIDGTAHRSYMYSICCLHLTCNMVGIWALDMVRNMVKINGVRIWFHLYLQQGPVSGGGSSHPLPSQRASVAKAGLLLGRRRRPPSSWPSCLSLSWSSQCPSAAQARAPGQGCPLTQIRSWEDRTRGQLPWRRQGLGLERRREPWSPRWCTFHGGGSFHGAR